jgi:hypothetical protein
MSTVDSLLHQCLVPDYDAEVPMHIFVTQDMVCDRKDLRFGWNQDFSLATCHHGISPFTVMAVSQETSSHRKRVQERVRRATLLTSNDQRRQMRTITPNWQQQSHPWWRSIQKRGFQR